MFKRLTDKCTRQIHGSLRLMSQKSIYSAKNDKQTKQNNPMTFEWIQRVQQDILNITLADCQDLDSFVNTYHVQNKLLKEVGQGFSQFQLVNMAMHQLEKSHYKVQIEMMQVAYSVNAMAYPTLASLVHALQCRDIFDGKLFGGAPTLPNLCQSEIIKTGYSGSGFIKKVQFGTAFFCN